MYNDAEDSMFDIDIFEYSQKDKQSSHDNQNQLQLREVFKPVAFQQQKRRYLPTVDEPPKQNSCCQSFCSSYFQLLLCWLILTAVLCSSIFLYIKCETVDTSTDLESYNELSLVNKTRIPTWEEITGTTENSVKVTEVTTNSRPTYFPSKLNDNTATVAKKQENLNPSKEEFYCPHALLVIVIIIASFGFLFVFLLVVLPNKC